MFVGHDWGALIVWDLARLHPERVRAVVGVSVPFMHWPAPPTQLMKMMYGDRFFYILYFQQPGVAEDELEADPYDSLARVMWSASGVRFAQRDASAEMPPMEGTGFLTMMSAAAAAATRRSGGSVADRGTICRPTPTSSPTAASSARSATTATSMPTSTSSKTSVPSASRMPVYFIGGTQDVVNVMDPSGVERMQNLLPDFRGSTILEDVGHWTQQEAPAAFNEALLGFL